MNCGLWLLALVASVAHMLLADKVYYELKPMSKILDYDKLSDFVCPKPSEATQAGGRVISVLKPQLRPGFIFKSTGFPDEVALDHWVQLCYHSGATYNAADDDGERYQVTLATFATQDRLTNLIRVMDTWKGRISLAYFQQPDASLEILDSLLRSYPGMAERLAVHVVFANQDEPFPINLLRNVASIAIPTSHTFHCDIDFVTSMSLNPYLNSAEMQLILAQTLTGYRRQLIVVPALEANHAIPDYETQQVEDIAESASPAKMKMLIADKLVAVFHAYCQHCQGSTDINRWMKVDHPYNVTAAPIAYEPFIIVPTYLLVDGTRRPFLMWDEIFSGYGRDKTAYFYQLRLFYGYDFLVLPNVFIYHKKHEKSPDSHLFTGDAKRERIKMFKRRMQWWETRRNTTGLESMNDVTRLFSFTDPAKISKERLDKTRDSVIPMFAISLGGSKLESSSPHQADLSAMQTTTDDCFVDLVFQVLLLLLVISALFLLIAAHRRKTRGSVSSMLTLALLILLVQFLSVQIASHMCAEKQ